MRIVYPYNEILPKKTAHDVFIFDECAALTHVGMEVTLLCGKGSASDQSLFNHYHVLDEDVFTVRRLPIIRKNNRLNLSWNRVFFFYSQRLLKQMRPDWVFLSVRKQGYYHLLRKISGIRYVYEVHELAYYPHMGGSSKALRMEQIMFAHADRITVTTNALKEILCAPPYSLHVPIDVVPLAVKKERLPPPHDSGVLTLMYVGQLYAGQGIAHLITALAKVNNVRLIVVGGRQEEIASYQKLATELHLNEAIDFLGFVPPSHLSEIAKKAHAFVAPFDRSGRMPYVAHTKLFEYAHWGRPIIAPRMPTVEEHFVDGKGVLLYEPENTQDLVRCIRLLQEAPIRHQLQESIASYAGQYSWEHRAQRYQELL